MKFSLGVTLWALLGISFGSVEAQLPCSPGFEQCTPVGASRREVPVIGPDLARFYLELVYTVQSVPKDLKPVSHGPMARQGDFGDSLCCAAESTCSMIRSFRIAFCWDRFTTSYFLPDGSYGSASNGSYYTPQGDTANLITGEYQMHDGTLGNIYNESPADKPESDELPLPTPFTSSGVGAAIPASQLGAQLSASTTTILISTLISASFGVSVETPFASSLRISSTPTSTSPPNPTLTTTLISSYSAGEIITAFPGSSSIPYVGASVSATRTIPQDSSTTSDLLTVGSAGVSATSWNISSPIIPPITNLAAATVVYCMAAKVLISLVAAVML